jgi:hypothetical protein
MSSSSSPSAGGVVGRGHRGDGFGAGPGVPLQGAEVVVPALDHQQWQVHACLGEVGEGGMAQLVQRPALLAIVRECCLNRYSARS